MARYHPEALRLKGLSGNPWSGLSIPHIAGPDYKYKPEDINFIKKETGKEREDIQYWARQFRWQIGINKLPGGLNAEEFLRSSPESSYDKVT